MAEVMESSFLRVACELEEAGLVWQPEIGDEVIERDRFERVSILIDTHAMTPVELRQVYLWLPTLEQMVLQFEIRQAILFHAGLELTPKTVCYKAVIRSSRGPIEAVAESLRTAVGITLRDLLLSSGTIH